MSPNLPALVTLFALGLYVGTQVMTARSRRRFAVRAPAVTGAPEFERALRVQQNTLEQIILFLPALWLFALYVSAPWASAIGCLWVVARAYYAVCYYREPETRRPGFLIAFAGATVLWLGALLGVLRAML